MRGTILAKRCLLYGWVCGGRPGWGFWAAQVSRGHGRPNKQNFQNFEPWFLSRHENKKDAERPYDHFAGGIAPRSLLCVRKRMFSFFIKHALGGLHLEKNIQILIYFKRLPTSCRGAELTFFMLTKILIYFSRLPTSCAHLLYPSDGYFTVLRFPSIRPSDLPTDRPSVRRPSIRPTAHPLVHPENHAKNNGKPMKK